MQYRKAFHEIFTEWVLVLMSNLIQNKGYVNYNKRRLQ